MQGTAVHGRSARLRCGSHYIGPSLGREAALSSTKWPRPFLGMGMQILRVRLPLAKKSLVGGQVFTVQREADVIPGLNFFGSMPHLAAEENWTTTFTFIRRAAFALPVRMSFPATRATPR